MSQHFLSLYPCDSIHLRLLKKKILAINTLILNPNYRISENKLIGQHMVEQPANLVCILDDIPSMKKLPKYHQYDDDYVLQT